MIDTPIEIGSRLVGAGRPPMIIAEMSANHRGTLAGALRIVQAAADHGADAIKLQTFTPATLTIDSHRPEHFIDDPGGLWHGRRLWDLYQEAHTPWEWHAELFAAARASGLACISTAYDLTSVAFLISLGVDAIKIASFELIHTPLLDAAARTGLPLLVSTGMATVAEVDAAVHAVRRGGGERLVLLKCTSAYPAREEDANLRTMESMRVRYGCAVGFSDHTPGPHAAFAATVLGAAVIEKHLTIARADGGVDAAFSIEPLELRALADGCDRVWRSLGDVRYGPLPAEAASLRERPSLYVVRPVRRGDPFTAENLRVIRPGNGLAPARHDAVLGRRAARDLEAGAPLAWEMVEGGEP